jgi:shikimate kinase
LAPVRTNHIILVGFKHTGKSQHGAALAATIGYRFVDTDTLIQEIDSTESGMRRLVRDIYAEDGRERFQQLEAASCRLAMEMEESVIATGGGLCDNLEALAAFEGSLFVHLRDSFDSLSRRIFRSGIPAFLHTNDPALAEARLRELYDRRVAAYNTFADVVIDVSRLGLEEAQNRTIAEVKKVIEGNDGR